MRAITIHRYGGPEVLCRNEVPVPIAGRYTLDNVEEAHALLEGRRQVGKAVMCLRPS